MMINISKKIEDMMDNFSRELKYVKENQMKIIEWKNKVKFRIQLVN